MDKNLTNIGLFLLRITVGCTMLFQHGLPKVQSFSTLSQKFPDPIHIGSTASLLLAIFAELACSVFIIIGLKFRWALIPLIITMSVAAFIQHGADPFGKKELAVLYLTIYTTLLMTGAGKFALEKS